MLAVEAGYWLGHTMRRPSEEEKKSPVSPIAGAILGLAMGRLKASSAGIRPWSNGRGGGTSHNGPHFKIELGERLGGAFRSRGKVHMLGKKIAVLSTSTALLISGWTFTTLTVAGGATALIGGCSADRSDSRQDARTGARTSERTEQRVEDRHD
jgi:hypothetical protein